MIGQSLIDRQSSLPGALLEISELTVEFHGRDRRILANDRVSLSVKAGETLGIVGESGSGKSVLCRAILGLLPSPPASITARMLAFNGIDLLQLEPAAMRRIRGHEIAMIFQNPMTSLNPVWPIGKQIAEPLRRHRAMSRRAARQTAIELLARVGIPAPAKRIDDYPHQWSGGMLQRAVIAMALAGKPKLILADEPTTALDVTIQDQILTLLLDIQNETGMSLILVSHDMGVIAETADRIAVMYAGRVVELASTRDTFENPRHPYTEGLLRSIPRLQGSDTTLASIPGLPPDLGSLAQGCSFSPRCPLAVPRCSAVPVALSETKPGHATACLFPEGVPNIVWDRARS
jgi:oligopeptide/dipeptide ABC transporter ATP-binding protein